jgi:hypothetical protein
MKVTPKEGKKKYLDENGGAAARGGRRADQKEREVEGERGRERKGGEASMLLSREGDGRRRLGRGGVGWGFDSATRTRRRKER